MKEGFKCKCGEQHNFTPYVYAHWTEMLVFTCPKCDRKSHIRNGIATPAKTVKPKHKAKP